MKKTIFALTCLGLIGCQPATSEQPNMEPYRIKATTQPSNEYRVTLTVEKVDRCPYVIPGTRYIPETGEYIDYVTDPKDFESWHYMGRERSPYDWEREIHAAELEAAESPDIPDLTDRVAVLKSKYADKIEEAARNDKQRFDDLVKEMIAEAKQAHTPTAETSTPEQ